MSVEKKSLAIGIGIGAGACFGVLLLAALATMGGGGATVEVAEDPVPAGDSAPAEVPQVLLSALLDNGYTPMGSPDAPIKLVEFGDYQCHFCNEFYKNTEARLIRDYVDTGLVQFHFKDFTIIGPDSTVAALGARCAEDQGLFWEYHDTLYDNYDGENTGWASLENLMDFAGRAGLNVVEWSSCMDAAEHSDILSASNQDARALDIQGTPAFFAITPDGQVTRISGAQPYDVFSGFFDEALGR